MPHRFKHENAWILDSEERKKFFNPEKVLGILEGFRIRKEVAFDIGAGTGYLTIPLAKMFKRVYAVEISFEMAKILRKRLEEEMIKNVGIIVTDKPPEIEFSIDLVVFSDVLHEMENPKNYLLWAKRSNFILVAEWKKIPTDFGPPIEDRISLEDLLTLSEGFDVLRVEELPYHYVFLLKTIKKK
ncbi:MAG: methyltransferase domain-containing protein [Archaeoglobaceae archaeon]|nr:methyltransferase domain-containing protein [Archaeoglobaceae archaeon]MDW7989416.1 methyltransferase domain-containing protein [Archaeoglobaceae archaeon]